MTVQQEIDELKWVEGIKMLISDDTTDIGYTRTISLRTIDMLLGTIIRLKEKARQRVS